MGPFPSSPLGPFANWPPQCGFASYGPVILFVFPSESSGNSSFIIANWEASICTLVSSNKNVLISPCFHLVYVSLDLFIA